MNQKIFSLIAIFILFSLKTLANGGFHVGNGGHIVVCDGIFDRKEYLLDLFEAKHLFGFNPSLSVGNKYDRKLWMYNSKRLSIAALRMLEVVPNTHPIMSTFKTAQHYIDIASFQLNENIDEIETKDAGEMLVPIPEKCTLLQLAVFKKNHSFDEIIINKSFYQSMGKSNYISLMIHEALHHYFGKQKSTLAARQIVWWLNAPDQFRKSNKDLILQIINEKQPVPIENFILNFN